MSDSPLTFIIPVCHPANCKDWPALQRNLAQTIASVSAQTCDHWKAVVVANHGAALPHLPPHCTVCRVDFAPNPHYEQGESTLEHFRESIRLDKGRRVLAGILAAGDMGHVMIVDADDLVSNRLSAFVAAHPEHFGWYVDRGYAYQEGSSILARFPKFHELCGTSHIVRADLFDLPHTLESAPEPYIRQILGSHIVIQRHLAQRGTPLAPLPFPGAIYRVGHALSHSQSKGLYRAFFKTDSILRHPGRILKNLARARPLTRAIRTEFFAA